MRANGKTRRSGCYLTFIGVFSACNHSRERSNLEQDAPFIVCCYQRKLLLHKERLRQVGNRRIFFCISGYLVRNYEHLFPKFLFKFKETSLYTIYRRSSSQTQIPFYYQIRIRDTLDDARSAQATTNYSLIFEFRTLALTSSLDGPAEKFDSFKTEIHSQRNRPISRRR